MATLFSKIIRGEIPSHRIAESEDCYAFLDISPVQMGHTLVVPKREEDDFYDLSDQELSKLMAFAKQIAQAIKQATDCRKVGSAVMGLEVNHAHLHLIPLKELGDMDMYRKLTVSTEELSEMAKQIRLHLPESLK